MKIKFYNDPVYTPLHRELKESDFRKKAYIVQTFNENMKPKELICYLNGFGFRFKHSSSLLDVRIKDAEQIGLTSNYNPNKALEEPDTGLILITEYNVFTDETVNEYWEQREQKTKNIVKKRKSDTEQLGFTPLSIREPQPTPVYLKSEAYFKTGEAITTFKCTCLIRLKEELENKPKEIDSNKLAIEIIDLLYFAHEEKTLEAQIVEGFIDEIIEYKNNPEGEPRHDFLDIYPDQFLSLSHSISNFIEQNTKNQFFLNNPLEPVKQNKLIIPHAFTIENNKMIKTPFKKEVEGTRNLGIRINRASDPEPVINEITVMTNDKLDMFDYMVWNAYNNLRKENPEEPIAFFQIADFLKHKDKNKRKTRSTDKLSEEIKESAFKLMTTLIDATITSELNYYREKNDPRYNKLQELRTDEIACNFIYAVYEKIEINKNVIVEGLKPLPNQPNELMDYYLDVLGQRFNMPEEWTNPLKPSRDNINLFYTLISQISIMPYEQPRTFFLRDKLEILKDYKQKKKDPNAKQQTLTRMPNYQKKRESEANFKDRQLSINLEELMKNSLNEGKNKTRFKERVKKILDVGVKEHCISAYHFIPNERNAKSVKILFFS